MHSIQQEHVSRTKDPPARRKGPPLPAQKVIGKWMMTNTNFVSQSETRHVC